MFWTEWINFKISLSKQTISEYLTEIKKWKKTKKNEVDDK